MDQGSMGVEDAAAAVTVHLDDGGVVVVPDQVTTEERQGVAKRDQDGDRRQDDGDPGAVIAEATARAKGIIAGAEKRLAEANRVRQEAEAEAARIRETMEAEATARAEAVIAESVEQLTEANRLRQEAAELDAAARERAEAAEAAAEVRLRQAEEEQRRLVDMANEDVREIHAKAEARMAEATRRLEEASVTVDRMLRTARQEAEARSAEIVEAARRRSAQAEATRRNVLRPATEFDRPEEVDLRELEREGLFAPRISPYSRTDWEPPESEQPHSTVIEMPKWFEPRASEKALEEEAEGEPKMSGRRRRALPKIEDPDLLVGLRSLRPEPKR